MLILVMDTGELGNRLVTFSYMLVLGREMRISVLNLSFWPYARYFAFASNPLVCPWRDIPPPGMWDTRIGNAVGAMAKQLPRAVRAVYLSGRTAVSAQRADDSLYRVDNEPFNCPLKVAKAFAPIAADSRRGRLAARLHLRCPAVAEGGTSISARSLISKHAQYLRRCFRLRPLQENKVAAFIAPLRKRYRTLIGVHRRGGDFRFYQGGKWYFEDVVYRRTMEHFRSCTSGGDVAFIVASNEAVPEENFKGLEVYRPPGDPISDMYALSRCDQIIAAPSTFSGWASFVGDTPIYQINDSRLEGLNEPSRCAVWSPQYY